MSRMKEIPSLSDAVEPSDFVFEYKDLDVQSYIGKLAPSFGLLLTYKLYKPIAAISREFVEPEFFLSLTDFNPTIIEALKAVNKTLQASSGTITLPLTQEMGFGKTHFETLLFHLYTEVPAKWKKLKEEITIEDAIEKLTEKTLYKPENARKTIIFPVDLKSTPESMDPYTAIFESCIRIINEYKKEEYSELIHTLNELKKLEPKRAATELAKQIKKTGLTISTLILIDELYASVYETIVGGDDKQINSLTNLLVFITSFTDELKEHSPVALVYASAQQDIDKFDELLRLKDHMIKEKPTAATLLSVIEYFKSRTSRVQIPTKQITSEDVINIVRKRLLNLKAPIKDLNETVARACMELAIEYTTKDVAIRYYEELLKTYPFTPTYRAFSEKLLAPTLGGDLPKTQHVRDLLKVTASIIARVYEDKGWKELALISPAYLTHDDVNHLVEERISMEWGRLYESCLKSLDEIKESSAKSVAKKLLSVVYIKSFTTNVSKLLDVIRAPDILPREEVLLRGSSLEDLLFSVIGAASEAEMLKFHDAYNSLSKSTPYIIDVEHEGKKYLVLSFVFNPMELVESFKREEIASFRTPEGLIDYQKMIEYFRTQLETEYNITGTFTQISEKPDKPKLVLINYDVITAKDEKDKPKFLNYLDKEKFTILITTPWSIGERIIEGKKITDCIEETITILSNFKNDIAYPNMFAILFPEIEKSLLEMLCTRIAEMHAARKVVTFLKVEKKEEIRIKRLELAKRAPTYQTLVELLKEEKKQFEDIIIEIMESLQKRIEEYAKNYTNTAVQNYVSEFVSAFKQIIYLDINKESFKEDVLEVKYETKDDLGKVFAELPLWIVNAVTGKCSIDDRNSIISKIIKHVIEPYTAKHKEILTKGERQEIEAKPLVDVAMKGWKKLPIRPISRKEMETAVESISGSHIIEGVTIKTYPRIEKETTKIIIEPVIPKPQPPVTVALVNTIEIKGPTNVIIGLGLLNIEKLGNSVKTFNLTIETAKECILKIEKASLEDLEEWIIGEDPIITLSNRLSAIISEIKRATLQINLTALTDEQELKKKLMNEGISEESFHLSAG